MKHTAVTTLIEQSVYSAVFKYAVNYNTILSIYFLKQIMIPQFYRNLPLLHHWFQSS